MIPFQDLRRLHESLREDLRAASERVLASGRFLWGPETEAFEAELAEYLGVRYAIGVANGTDALELALRAAGVADGDEVIAPSHTAVATVCAIARSGATPVLVDLAPGTYCVDPAAVESAISPRTKAIVPVHLYGEPADIASLREIADRNHLVLIEDGAQAFGARVGGRCVGCFGEAAAFSFYPTKPLGALGDGGAVVTNIAALADRVRSLRFYGQSRRGVANLPGMNSRLDELQAALLRVKLRRLPEHQAERAALAARYAAALRGVMTPRSGLNAEHAWHLYVVRHPGRDALAAHLLAAGIGTMVHYPWAVHQQPAYHAFAAVSLPQTERAVAEILSLPLFVGLTHDEQDRVIAAVNAFPAEAAA